jgi:aminoglycoside 3-N-acetyltransferase
MAQIERPIITKSRLKQDLARLGIEAGQVVMLHASVKAIGWVVGGPDAVIEALLELLQPSGTLMMYVGWEDGTYEMDSWPPAQQRAYLAERSPFDPSHSRAYRKWSILTEYLRTWPGARRSGNPEASFAAVGAQAAWLVAGHPLQYGFGPGSPLEKLCQAGGQVLLLGSPLDAVTLLHYAEAIASVPAKRIVRYRQPMLIDGKKTSRISTARK